MKASKISKKIRALCVCLCLVLCALSFAACGGNVKLLQGEDYVMTEKREPLPVYSVSFDIIGGKDTMPVGGFFGPYTVSQSVNGQALPDYVSDEFFKLIKECGINLIVGPNEYFTAARNSVVEALTLAEKYGIGYFAQDSYVYDVINGRREPDSTLTNLLTQLNQYPAFVGIHTQDEPQTKLFEGLGKFTDAFYSYGLEGKHTYSNLLPDYYWGVNYTGTSVNISYEEYVQQFIEQTHPRYLSYDHYVFDSRNYEYYFSNLAVVRHKAQALAALLVLWFVLVLVYDLALLVVSVAGADVFGRSVLSGMMLANPASVFRLINQMGAADAALVRPEAAVLAGILIGWVLVLFFICRWVLLRRRM